MLRVFSPAALPPSPVATVLVEADAVNALISRCSAGANAIRAAVPQLAIAAFFFSLDTTAPDALAKPLDLDDADQKAEFERMRRQG
jgi:hypothetical protein